MQTAVEWLGLYIKGITTLNCDGIIEQAKEMEKQQIIDAWDNGAYGSGEFMINIETSQEYYNETYGSKGSDETKTK